MAIGGGSSEHLDQYQIETLAINHNPPIPTESIVCRESLEEFGQFYLGMDKPSNSKNRSDG